MKDLKGYLRGLLAFTLLVLYLMFTSCTKEVIVEVEGPERIVTNTVTNTVIITETVTVTVEPEVNTTYENDSLYRHLSNESTPYDFYEVFVQEASLYGYDFTNTVTEVIIEDPTGSAHAYAVALCDDRVHLGIKRTGPDSWETWTFVQKLHVMYHELGHDMLNLEHTCSSGQIMTGIDACGGGETITISQAELQYNADDSAYDWKRAVEDMFEGYEQIVRDCSL